MTNFSVPIKWNENFSVILVFSRDHEESRIIVKNYEERVVICRSYCLCLKLKYVFPFVVLLGSFSCTQSKLFNVGYQML